HQERDTKGRGRADPRGAAVQPGHSLPTSCRSKKNRQREGPAARGVVAADPLNCSPQAWLMPPNGAHRPVGETLACVGVLANRPTGLSFETGDTRQTGGVADGAGA